MNKNQILVVGSVALDDVETPFGKIKNALGGSASFFSVASRFFTRPSIVAVVGSDFPKKHLELFKRLSIDTAGVEVDKEAKTFHWAGHYGYDLNVAKTLKTELGAFQTFRPRLSPAHLKMPVVFLANIDPDLQRMVLNQMKHVNLAACDTMNYWIATKRRSLIALLKKVDIFFCNDAEARELTGEYHLLKAARAVLRLGSRLAVIKKGEHGALCVGRDYLFAIPAFPVEKIFDPTGAGDSFAGAFMGYLAQKGKLDFNIIKQGALYGSVVASFNVESFSLNRLAALTQQEIEVRCRALKKMTTV